MRIILTLVLVAIFSGGVCALLLQDRISLYQQIQNEQLNEKRLESTKMPYHIIFTGDIMLARDVEQKMATYGSEYPFVHMAPYLDADVVVGNFEASVPEVHVPTPSMTMQFSVSTKNIPALATANFTHLSLANNHADDYGSAGFAHTTKVLTNNGLVPFGSPFALATSSTTYIEAGEITVAIIGVYAVETLPTQEALVHAFGTASSKSDLQVVYVHWGNEYELTHSIAQEQLAHRMIDVGADLVIGHHPHVVQDIEQYKNALIFYSLGNFVFDQYFSTDVMQGLVLDTAISEKQEVAITLVPVSTEASRTAPRLMTGPERESFLHSLAQRSDSVLADAIEQGTLKLR